MLELKTKEDKTLYEIYKRLFAAATPPGDFDELVENAEFDKYGRRHIPFMDYEIENDIMDNIINSILDENKIKNEHKRKQYITTIYLGCSPKSKIEENKGNNTVRNATKSVKC
jgi:hypothetical protein